MTMWVSWSSGKDCAWALHRLRQDGKRVEALFTTVNGRANRVALHGVRRQLLEAQAAAIGLPLYVVELPWPCSDAEYQKIMSVFIYKARSSGVTEVAFGDLFVEEIRAYREKNLAGTGITPVFPLWGLKTDALAREMVNAGLAACLATVNLFKLDVSFVGRTFDNALLEALPGDVDACGENGEFHTFVYDGPMFSVPVLIEPGIITRRENIAYADLIPFHA